MNKKLPEEISFGEWLHQRRRMLDLTQQELAGQVGCARITLRRIESGALKPSKDLALILLEKLGAPQADREAWLRFARGLSGFPERSSDSVARKPITNLPTSLTSFIGREKELDEISDLIAKNRLVTFAGAGGIGKTRLSLEAAREMLNAFPNGVWFIDLAPLSDPIFVPQAIVTTLGLIEQANRPPQRILTDFLQGKYALLILDNCEHLIQACAQLAEASLSACPDLHILTTSREALSIDGETLYLVPSLTTPDLAHASLESLPHYEAVQLFLERAQSAMHDFSLTQDNAHAIAQVCYHLDGIPLAIELAAARVKLLRVEEIAVRLDDRFRFLTSSARTALPRHQTLQAMIDWSYDLLTEPERVLLRRLSVFAGGWSLEAAEQVTGGKWPVKSDTSSTLRNLQTEDILDLLNQLANKSLIIVERKQGQETRYHMLETIRQYARDKLREVGESQQLRDRQLEFFLKLATEAEAKLYGAEQVACLNRLEVELDNFRAALEWSLEEGDAESGIRLAGVLWRFWLMRDYWSEGYDRLKKTLSRKGSVSAAARAKALGRAGDLANRSFIDLVAAHTLWTESLALYRELGDEGGIAFSLYGLGQLAYIEGDSASGRSFLEESLTIYRKLNDKWGIALVLDTLSFTVMPSDLALARMLREECLALFRELSDYWDLMRTLHNYGEMARFEGDYARAKTLYQEARTFGRELGVAKLFLALQLNGLGYAVLRDGDNRRAVTHFKESMLLQREQGITTVSRALSIAGLAGVAAAQGQLVRAAQLLGAAQSLITAREAQGEYMEFQDRVEYDRDVTVVHAQLDEATFNVAWEAGQKMTLDEAVALALEENHD